MLPATGHRPPTVAEAIKQTTSWFTNMEEYREGMCCEDCSRLRTDRLMLEFLWLWDYFCYPISRLDKTWGLQETESPRFSTQLAHEDGKVVSLTHSCLYPHRDTPDTHLCYRLCPLQSHSAARKNWSMIIPSNLTWIRNRHISAWNTVPHPNTPQSASFKLPILDP